MGDVMKQMRPLILITDLGFILYWSVSLLMLLGVEIVPASWLFDDYENSIVYAANLFLAIWPCFYLPRLARA